jgi:hypothetical protein
MIVQIIYFFFSSSGKFKIFSKFLKLDSNIFVFILEFSLEIDISLNQLFNESFKLSIISNN